MKRFFAIALVLLLLFSLTSGFAAAPGSSGDPLISLTYINNSFLPTVRNDTKALVNSAIGKTYSDAEKKLREAYDGYLLRLGGYTGYTFAGAFTPVSLPVGTTAKLITGSTFVLTSGTASLQIEKGTVINISTGSEIATAAALTPNERYFCAEDTVAQFVAVSSATCLIDGYYHSGGTVIINPVNFSDVKSTDWFYTAVTFASDNNLFKGTTPTTFAPQMTMTRGMFVAVLHRLAGQPVVTLSSAFSDVPSSQYYYNAVVWANTNGIVSGYSDGKFHPDDLITREQMAVILSNYAQYAGYGTAYPNTSVYDSFPDKGSVSAYAINAAKWAAYNGLLSGSYGKLLPKNTASRSEVAQIMMNFCQRIVGM